MHVELSLADSWRTGTRPSPAACQATGYRAPTPVICVLQKPRSGESPGIQLGNIALRGEKGVLQVSGTDMLRLRWNPFHDYIAQRIVGVMQDAEAPSKGD